MLSRIEFRIEPAGYDGSRYGIVPYVDNVSLLSQVNAFGSSNGYHGPLTSPGRPLNSYFLGEPLASEGVGTETPIPASLTRCVSHLSVLGCSCGIDDCGPFSVEARIGDLVVEWRWTMWNAFLDEHVTHLRFARNQYEAAAREMEIRLREAEG